VTDKRSWPDRAARALATTFYSGYFPVAPGTVGAALAAVAIWFGKVDQGFPLLGMLLLFSLAGVWASGRAEELWGKDPGRVNWDEVVGMMLSLLFLPRNGMVFVAAFLAFRFFDILKPVPVSTAERLPRGWGIMADDIIAGIYTNIVVQTIVHFGLLKG
jgi:phosphatidylglycerophosphatase A